MDQELTGWMCPKGSGHSSVSKCTPVTSGVLRAGLGTFKGDKDSGIGCTLSALGPLIATQTIPGFLERSGLSWGNGVSLRAEQAQPGLLLCSSSCISVQAVGFGDGDELSLSDRFKISWGWRGCVTGGWRHQQLNPWKRREDFYCSDIPTIQITLWVEILLQLLVGNM